MTDVEAGPSSSEAAAWTVSGPSLHVGTDAETLTRWYDESRVHRSVVLEARAGRYAELTEPSIDGLTRQFANGLAARAGDGPVAVVLTNSLAAAAFVYGALLAGAHLVSLPLPARGADPERYVASLASLAASAGASEIVVDDDLIGLARSFGVATGGVGFRQLGTLARGKRGPVFEPGRFELTQFSSGTTGPPRGVRLSAAQLAANVGALLTALDVQRPETLCSWVPLSHDMGLVGTLLAGLGAASSDFGRGGTWCLLRPEDFLRSPRSWMRAVADLGGTITAAPAFAYAAAARDLDTDVTSLRAAIVGGEVAAPRHLVAFEQAAGIGPGVLCPAWGLSEVGVALTLSAPTTPWRSTELPESDGRGAEGLVDLMGSLVACGRPIPGVQVRGEGPHLAVRSPSLGRLLDGTPLADGEGWYPTGDLGFADGGEVVVTGRGDDVLLLGAANHDAGALERHLGELVDAETAGRLRSRGVAVVPCEGGYAVVVEGLAGEADLGRRLRRAAVDVWGRPPVRIVPAAVGALPRTPSGKLRRREATRLAGAGPTVVR